MRRWRISGTGPKCFKLVDIIRYVIEDLDAFIEANSRRVA